MKQKALLILPTRSTFMRVDEGILASIFDLKTVYLGQERSKGQYLKGILQALFTMARCRDCGSVLVWFADYHAAPVVLLARFLRRKSYVFVGGYDAVCYPEFDMGVYCSAFRGFCARLALRNCTHIIANHKALLSSSNTYYKLTGHPEGFYKLIPGLKTPATVIHNAITVSAPDVLEQHRKKQILTVGTTPRFQDFFNKGFDLLVGIARRRPDLSFVFVGIQDRWLPQIERLFDLENLANVEVHPHLEGPEFLSLMSQSAVYAQPSISEGMPNSLMEAMLMGCVPVGSNVAGIPTVIGKHGFIVDHRDAKLLEAALDQALAAEPDREAISQSIKERFSLENRKNSLQKLLSD